VPQSKNEAGEGETAVNLSELKFDNRFVEDLPGDPETGARVRPVHGALYSRVDPTPVAAPRLVAWSMEVAALLELDAAAMDSPELAQVLGGNRVLPGMAPYAAAYGGHQFGHWAGQLGDGRAITLGEVVNGAGERWEIQLKGAGRTPYSRSADGRAVLRSSIREFLCSEAMHHLRVPTTRALGLLVTGEPVVRDMFYDGRARAEPGAIVCRVAPSFVRFGNFELPASRDDVALLERLVDFTIRRDFPELAGGRVRFDALTRAAWYREICERTAVMVAHWRRVGFVHGVMNTDNMSVLGLTIDYGPYGWIDDYDPDWTPNTTDAGQRRYRFGQQAQVAHWNLAQLGRALLPLFEDAAPLQAGLDAFPPAYAQADRMHTAAKLGFAEPSEAVDELARDLYALLHAHEVDMTLFFRTLSEADPGAARAADDLGAFGEAFYDEAKRRAGGAPLRAWLGRYAERVSAQGGDSDARRARMRAVNPRYVLRNYLAQLTIDRAEQGDFGGIGELLDVLRRPYEDQDGADRFAQRRPDWARTRAGCSMLSCSS